MMKKSLLALVGAVFLMGAAPVTIWSGSCSGFKLTWTDTTMQIQAGSKPAFSLFRSFPVSETDMSCVQEQSLGLLSWVGPYLSFRQEDNWNCKGTAHPGAFSQFQTLDTRTKKPVALTALFPDNQILKALLADSVVRKALASQASKKTFASSQELLNTLVENNSECEYAFDEDMLEHFAFHHIQGQQVAVRIGLSHGCEAARGFLTQLGILLPIPPGLKQALNEAQKQRAGILMAEAEKRFEGKYSRAKRVDPGAEDL
jgi:hypothetical protein